MLCNCSKDLGCFLPGDVINFGFNAFCSGTFVFEVWSRGLPTIIETDFTAGDPITLENIFTEQGETTVKIKVPSDCSPPEGFNYITTADGACQFKFKSLVSTCG
jgi:hypothetical protein